MKLKVCCRWMELKVCCRYSPIYYFLSLWNRARVQALLCEDYSLCLLAELSILSITLPPELCMGTVVIYISSASILIDPSLLRFPHPVSRCAKVSAINQRPLYPYASFLRALLTCKAINEQVLGRCRYASVAQWESDLPTRETFGSFRKPNQNLVSLFLDFSLLSSTNVPSFLGTIIFVFNYLLHGPAYGYFLSSHTSIYTCRIHEPVLQNWKLISRNVLIPDAN